MFVHHTYPLSSTVASWRVKETERMVAIRTELTKVNSLGPVSFHSSSSLFISWIILQWCLNSSSSFLVLCQLGASVEEGPDYCIITPPEKLNITAIDTYDDHRMAMAFSLAACADVPVTIRDPGCTRKTFPNYFDVLSTFVRNWTELLKEWGLGSVVCLSIIHVLTVEGTRFFFSSRDEFLCACNTSL